MNAGELVAPDLILEGVNPSINPTRNTWRITPSADGNGVLSFQEYNGQQWVTKFTMNSGGGVLGTTTNDSAATGMIGEYASALTSGATATVTISIASPAVVTWAAHGLGVGSVVTFTTTVALPTGITASAPYYVISAGLTTGAFEISATPFGAAVNTSGSQSGVQTGTSSTTLSTGVTNNVAAIQLTPGDWDVSGVVVYHSGSGTIPNDVLQGISTASATVGAVGSYSYDLVGLVIPDNPAYIAPTIRVSIAATTTIYLVSQVDFSVNTLFAYGNIRARRMR